MHDVMPETLSLVEDFLAFCSTHAIPPMTLLVVPGCDWRDEQLDRLRDLAGLGHELAAHGWLHRVGTPQSLYHRLHSTLLSRNVAEHLALDGESILALMRRSHAWFAEHDLPAPSLYVPPAWALGDNRWHHWISRELRCCAVYWTCVPLTCIRCHWWDSKPIPGFVRRSSGYGTAAKSEWPASLGEPCASVFIRRI